MTIYDRPDEKVMAESALAGEVQDFPDILRGWGIAFDQTGGIPPMEWFNALALRTDQAIRYFMQRGLPEWSATEDYPQGAYVQYAGNSYLSKRANLNKLPSANVNDWGRWSITRDEFEARLPVVGEVRNARMLLAAPSASATYNADQVIVAGLLGGPTYSLSNIALTGNLATIGAGGMDTGAAPTSSFVGIYLIFNPATGAKALLGVNAGPALLPQVYGGANMPVGYTASALVSVWPSNGASQFVIGTQIDRNVNITTASVINSGTIQGSITAVSTTAFPKNARSVSGSLSIQSTSASSMSISIYAAGISVGQQTVGAATGAGQQVVGTISKMNITIPQTVYWSSASTAGTPIFGFNITSYDF